MTTVLRRTKGRYVKSRVITTAYGRPALDALRTVVTKAKRVDLMAPVTVLVPNNIAGIVGRRHLAHGLEGRGPGVAGIFVTTLPRLAEQLAAAALHPRSPATQPVVASAWRQALNANPGQFGKVKDHPATIRALGNAHRDLRDLTATGRARARDATPLSQDLLRLHEGVVATLASSWYDATDLLHYAADIATRHPERLNEQGEVVLYLPQGLSQAEVVFAKALTSNTGLTAIVGMTGVSRADEAVHRTLRRLGLEEPTETPKPQLATRVIHASDSDDEVRCVVREVVVALAKTPAHRIAVLYGGAQPYSRLLHEHLTAAGLKVNGPATRAVHERAIARGFLGVLSLAQVNLPRAATFMALAEAPVNTFAGVRVPVARWERASRNAGVVGGHADDWGQKLSNYIAHEQAVIDEQQRVDDPSQSRIDAATREIEAAHALNAFIENLQARLQAGQATRTWGGLGDWALELFHDLYGQPESLKKLPQEEQYAAVVVEQSLRGLATLDTFEPTAALTGLIEVLSLELESALPRVGRFGEGIFVGPISASIGMDLDKLFVVGLAEDAYPGRLHEDALLNDKVRKATDGELEASRDRVDAKHRHLLAAFASAPDVTASFPRGDLRRSTERLPSRFLLHTLRGITGNDGLAATEWDNAGEYKREPGSKLVGSRSFADEITTTPQPGSEQEWRIRASSADVGLKDPIIDGAKILIGARDTDGFTRFDGNLSHVSGLPDFAHDDRVVSPTSLEAYAICPHRYFVQKLLHVEPLEQPEEVIQISAMEVGNLIHESMDALISECAEAGTLPSYGEPWSDAQRRRLQEIATEKAVEFAARGVTGHPRLWEADRAQVLVDLDRMLDDDSRWRATRDAAVVRSELAFGREGAEAVAIKLSDGEVRMRGSADKVDKTRDGVLLVTDIKSGKADKFKALADDPVAAGTKLQLPVYAYAARQLLAGDEVEAMYWFVRRDAGKRIEVKLDDDVQKRYAETLATLVSSIANGLFPGKPSEKPGYVYVDCEFCTPGGLGHDQARARYERKRQDPLLEPLIRLVDPGALPPTGSAAEGANE